MNDKALHMIAGLIISLALSLLYGPLIGLAVAIVAGLAKEIWDYMGHGTPDFKDALATTEGGIIGCIMLAIWQAV